MDPDPDPDTINPDPHHWFLQVCCISQVGQGGPGEREGQEPRGDGDRGQSQGRGRQGTGKLVS